MRNLRHTLLGPAIGLVVGLAGLAMVATVPGCGRDTPSSPTWVDDVRPILMANCVRCHGYPATGGAPDSFRLDVYDDWTAPDGRVLRGAGTMAEFIKVRVEHGTMPPRFPIDDRQIGILAAWRESSPGTAMPPPKGSPRRSNIAPVVTLTRPLQESVTDTGALVVEYEISDANGDPVHGELRVGTGDATTSVLVDRSVHGGRGTAMWDAGTFAPGSYKLFWVLDDGIGSTAVQVGTHEVTHANTAPSIAVVTPALYDIIADQDLPYDITIDLADPDPGLGLKITLEAIRGTDRVMLGAPEMDATVGTYTFQLTDTTNLPEGPGWVLEVTVTDGENSRTVRSGSFVVGHRTTTDSFADIGALGYCIKCHPGDGTETSASLAIPNLEHNFGDYATFTFDNGMDAGPGPGAFTGDVYRLRGLIYRRVLQLRNMPPITNRIHHAQNDGPTGPGNEFPTEADFRTLENWLLSGAPCTDTPEFGCPP